MLPSCRHLRHLGVEPERSPEMQIVRLDVVSARQVYSRPGHAKTERTELNILVLEMKDASHVGEHVSNRLILRLPLPLTAERVDVALNAAVEELAAHNMKTAIQNQLLVNAASKRRDPDLGRHLDPARHEWFRLNSKPKQFDHLAVGHVHIQINRPRFAVMFENRPAGSER